jgi:hypothetical protein
MDRKRVLMLAVVASMLLSMLPGLAAPPAAQAVPDIFASPVQAGCYLEKQDRCKIHVDPFTITIASVQKLVRFRLLSINYSAGGTQAVIYDFRTDQSNPVPFLGTSYTPSLVAKDFAATCNRTYRVSLQGQDSGDSGMLNLGLTTQFSCPVGTYKQYLPTVGKN